LNGRLTHYQASYRQRVSRLFTDIRKVNSHSPIFVFGIYNPVYVYFPQVSFISRAVAANNTVTKSVAQKHSQIYFIPINKPLSDGQYRTAKSRQRLRQRAAAIGNQSNDANEIEALLNGNATQSNRYLSTEDHFHPNQTGYQIMTNLLYKQLSQHLDWVKG
jgi:lysophospholipase L1-like esterase